MFLDIAAAFASVCHLWLAAALARMGLPQWLLDGLLALYDQGMAINSFNGESDLQIAMLAGIKQGCPSSGSVSGAAF